MSATMIFPNDDDDFFYPTAKELIDQAEPSESAMSFTRQGLITLGEVMKRSRMAIQVRCAETGRHQSIGLRALGDYILRTSGIMVSKDTLSALENGNSLNPTPVTLLAIVGSQYVRSPRDGRPYTNEELIYIACEVLNPYTDECRPGFPSFVVEASIMSHAEKKIQQNIRRPRKSKKVSQKVKTA